MQILQKQSERLIYFIILILIFFLPSQIYQARFLVLFAYFINIRLLIQYRNIIPLFVFFIFSISYIAPFYYHFFFNTKVAVYDSFNESKYLLEVVRIYTLYLITIFFFSKSTTNYIFLKQRLTNYSSSKKYFIAISIALIIAIFGLKGENLFIGAYGHIEKQQSAIFEYSLIFILISITYLDSKKNKLYLLLLLIFFIILKDVLYGGRITSVQLILLIYILLYEDKIPKIWVYIILGTGLVFMEVIGAIRSNPALFISGNFTYADFLFTENKEYMMSNQGDVAQASARLIGLIEINILDYTNRFFSFISSIASIFTPGITISELGKLSSYKMEMYKSGGGGLMPVYFFVWLSYPGVILSGLIVSKIINIFLFTKNNYLLVYACLVMSTYPRWLAYDPITMFKLCGYVFPIYFIFNKFKISYKQKF